MRLLVIACVWTSILLGYPHRGSAQELIGVVHITGATTPAVGAAVVLIDSSGAIVRGVLTREDGRFTLHAPHAGVYRVRARQIGFSPDSSGLLQLDRTSATTIDLSLKHFAAVLTGVNVSEKARCAIAPAAGTLALQLWEDVQSALTATVITESGGPRNDALLTRFTREIDLASGRVLRSTSWQLVGSSSEPYSALPADSLAARGFVVKEGQDVVYYAPDARTLLSDSFARTHCFRPSEDPDHAGLIGLAFMPVRREDIGQVSGALWLDKTSKELRYLEFRYSSPDLASRGDVYDSANATGRIDYEKLPQGNWIVNRWLIRVPIVEVREARTVSSNGSLGVGGTLISTRIAQLKSLWEIGGEAQINADSSVASQIDAGSVIQGHVVKGGTGADASQIPITGFRVELSMPGDTAQGGRATSRTVRSRYTDTDGGFHFDSLPPGDYVMHVASAKLDTLAVLIPDRAIHVNAATRMTITTMLPTTAAILRDLCGRNLQEDEMALHGIVRDQRTGQPAVGAIVKAYWYDAINTGRNFSAHQQNATTVSGSDGRYALCTTTPRGTLHLSASLNNRRSPDAQLQPAPDRIRMFDFTIP